MSGAKGLVDPSDRDLCSGDNVGHALVALWSAARRQDKEISLTDDLIKR